jgi:hypothetical protein
MRSRGLPAYRRAPQGVRKVRLSISLAGYLRAPQGAREVRLSRCAIQPFKEIVHSTTSLKKASVQIKKGLEPPTQMDTRYWGPSAWRLLHLITFGAKKGSSKAICEFFNTLPYVLPCKHCRTSLSEYITKDPVDCAIKEERLTKWLWRIHNAVNAKLRRQRIPTAPDPPFEKVAAFYEQRLGAGCSRTAFEGWEFLFSVAEAHPFSRGSRLSTPIEGHPPLEELEAATPLERNRWNVMSPEERLPFYDRFWELLPEVFPFQEWSAAWRRAAALSVAAAPQTCSREGCLKGVWAIRRAMEEDLELLNRTTYASLCKELRYNRVGCGRKTCRRKRGAS